MLKDDLEIYMITYNRKQRLSKTLQHLFSEESAIRNYPITILDNVSTDGSSEMIDEYCKKYSNLRHIRHHRNIGGNANIARAFELASKKYVWILCDDDEYDFSHWDEVEAAAEKDYDAILVANYVNPKKNIGYLIKQMTFTPSTIYKTDLLNQTVMSNLEFSIHNMFPHLAVACSIINDPQKKIYICDNWAVRMQPNPTDSSYIRGLQKNKVHPYMSHMFWSVGYVNAVQMIEDDKVREEVLQYMCEDLKDVSWKHNLDIISLFNKSRYENYLRNWLEIYVGFSKKQRLSLINYVLINYLKKILKNIISLKNGRDKQHKVVTLLGFKFKFKRRVKILQLLFSVKNSKNKKHKVITVLGFKIGIRCSSNKIKKK